MTSRDPRQSRDPIRLEPNISKTGGDSGYFGGAGQSQA